MTVAAEGQWSPYLPPPIVGLAGRAQHGKDTVGRFLVQHWSFVRLSFADSLKDLAYRINPVIPLGEEPAVTARLRELVDRWGWEKAKTYPEVRRFLQELGTQAREVLGDDVWTKVVEKKMFALGTVDQDGYGVYHGGGPPVVITDVRFPNEAELVRRYGGHIVLVTRPDFDNGVDPNHDSERQVADLGHRWVLVNDGTLEELEEKLAHLYVALELTGRE